MNFISTFDELSKLYEEKSTKVEEACDKKKLTETTEDEEIEIEIVDDEEVVEEPQTEEPEVDDDQKQTIIECSNCGALVIVDEITVDEETDLVNVDDKCKFCEEKAGYAIIGAVVPYEEISTEEPIEEGIFDKFKNSNTAKAETVTKDDHYVILSFDVTNEDGSYELANKTLYNTEDSAKSEAARLEKVSGNAGYKYTVVTVAGAEDLLKKTLNVDVDYQTISEGIFDKFKKNEEEWVIGSKVKYAGDNYAWSECNSIIFANKRDAEKAAKTANVKSMPECKYEVLTKKQAEEIFGDKAYFHEK
jgi:hypothetical protein